MSQPELDRIESLFHEALDLPPESDRLTWLKSRCNGDAALFDEVSTLLDAQLKMISAVREAPGEPPIPSAHFGPYRAISLLGRGGMGAVYLAERADGQFQQTVALKVMAGYLAHREFFRRFEAERQFLASMNHHNITRLLDGGVSSGGDPYLVTEYVDGETIDRYCDRNKLNIEQRIQIFLQVCEAVDYAHRNLIVHRDLKPANILVDRQGTVKLLDFGTAALTASQDNPTVTRMRMLTPRYSSPEQLRGERAKIGADIFSLGVIFYELLTGAWPFGDPDSILLQFDRIAGRITAKPLVTAVSDEAAKARSASRDHLRRALKGDLSAIVQKALENDPALRYDSVRALAADIENFLDARPVAARSHPAWYYIGKFLRRHWIPLTVGAVFIAGLSTTTVVAIHQANLARTQARIALDEARKSERVTKFLRSILTVGTQAGGADVTVRQMVNAIEPSLEKSWQDDPLAEATLRSNLGATYVTLRQPELAVRQLERAVALFRSQGRHVDAADALLVMGISGELGAKSIVVYQQALEELRLAGKDAPLALVFRVKVYLAGVLKDFYRIQESKAMADEAIGFAGRDPAMPADQRSAAFEILGEALLADGRFDEAEAALRQAIDVNRDSFDAWATLARSSSLKQNFSAAADLARHNYDLATNVGQEDKAEAEVWWARYRAEAGEVDEAMAQIEEALPGVRRYIQRGYVLAIYEQAAASVWNRGGQFGQAAECARRALDALRDDRIPETHPVTAATLENLGDALRGLKRYGEAKPLLEQASQIYGRLGPVYAPAAKRIQAALDSTSQLTGDPLNIPITRK